MEYLVIHGMVYAQDPRGGGQVRAVRFPSHGEESRVGRKVSGGWRRVKGDGLQEWLVG